MLNTPRTILTRLLPTKRVNSTKPCQKSKCPTGTDSPGEHRNTGVTTSIAQTALEGWEEPLELGPCTHTAPGKEVSPPHLVTVEQHHWFSPPKAGHLPAPSMRKPLFSKGAEFLQEEQNGNTLPNCSACSPKSPLRCPYTSSSNNQGTSTPSLGKARSLPPPPGISLHVCLGEGLIHGEEHAPGGRIPHHLPRLAWLLLQALKIPTWNRGKGLSEP